MVLRDADSDFPAFFECASASLEGRNSSGPWGTYHFVGDHDFSYPDGMCADFCDLGFMEAMSLSLLRNIRRCRNWTG